MGRAGNSTGIHGQCGADKGDVAMATITFSAFSFLRPKLESRNIGYSNVRLEIPEGISVKELVESVGLEQGDVEAAFVNGRVVPMDSVLHNDDRVGLVPPGTPGPYRVLLGIFKPK